MQNCRIYQILNELKRKMLKVAAKNIQKRLLLLSIKLYYSIFTYKSHKAC